MIKHGVRNLGFALLLLGVTGPAWAEMVRDMYSAQVPVADQSSAELARASSTGLSEVLVRVSGSEQVLRNPVIVAALAKSRSHVQQYSYATDSSVARQLMVTLLFDRTFVTDLVIEAGAPIWTTNRPTVLVWLVKEDTSGRQFVGADTAPTQVAELMAEFSRRGVPPQLPLYDLVDTAAVTVDQAWGLDEAALISASARYQLSDVLAGRFYVQSSGRAVGEWTYLFAGGSIQRSITADNEELFLRQGVNLVAEAMAERYAVAASVNDGGLTVSVMGVTGYAEYAAVVAWLESLELVDWANVESVRSDSITLRLQAQADATQLAATIEINKRLVPLPPVGVAGAQLNYQWKK